jgi:hypothetical protein
VLQGPQQFRHGRQPVQLGAALVAGQQVRVQPIGVGVVEPAQQIATEQPPQVVVAGAGNVGHRSTPISSNACRNARTA